MTWCEKVQARVRGVVFHMPDDSRNPMFGWYCVEGPTGETGVSHRGMEHAAACFLSYVHGNEEAKRALLNWRES